MASEASVGSKFDVSEAGANGQEADRLELDHLYDATDDEVDISGTDDQNDGEGVYFDLNEGELQDMMEPRFFERGMDELYLEGLVNIDKVFSKEAHGHAVGTSVYSVVLSRGLDGLTGTCTCPAFAKNGPCKHVAAVGLALIDYNKQGAFYTSSDYDKQRFLKSLSNAEYSQKVADLKERTKKELQKKTKEDLVEQFMKLFEYGSLPDDPWVFYCGKELQDILHEEAHQEKEKRHGQKDEEPSRNDELAQLKQKRQNCAAQIAKCVRERQKAERWMETPEARRLKNCERILQYKLTKNELGWEIARMERELRDIDRQIKGLARHSSRGTHNAAESARYTPAHKRAAPEQFQSSQTTSSGPTSSKMARK
eukprot:gb/GECG01013638.1/.p1 GENE.gb/GECG01013638.1/~~gb/GECG01013638.1/.p1  ORF type:complete len:368 (+),score=70.56 gb/GECG01013638.1/:1-1104(+)